MPTKADPGDSKTPTLDPESRAMLDKARKGNVLRYAMVCKGPKVIGLSVFKRGQADAKVRQLKQAGSKGQGYSGVVTGRGPNLQFQLLAGEGHEEGPVRDAILKKFLKDAAGLMSKPTFEIVHELSEVGDTEKPPEGAESGERVYATPNIKGLLAALKQLTPAVQKVVKRQPESKAELMALVKRAKDAIDANQPGPAKAALVALGERLKRRAPAAAPAPRARPPVPIGRRATERWMEAKEHVDERLDTLAAALRATKDANLERIAHRGLGAITGRLQAGVRVAFLEIDASREDTKRAKAIKHAESKLGELRTFFESDKMVRLIDDNPFGVRMDVASTMDRALADIASMLSRS
ncbi:MAG: hypothetical protein AAGK04_08645 [Planctomycetota bacterium]